MKIRLLIHVLLFVPFAGHLYGQGLSEKAITFLETLSEDLRSQALFTLNDEERYNMNYVPLPRKGPRFHDFNAMQRGAALDLLKSSLSQEGFRKTEEIRSLEKILRVIENDPHDTMPDGKPRRDPLNYHFSIFGNPAADKAWGWRFEGHHLSLNFTASDQKLTSATPTFFGTNPGVIQIRGHQEKEVLREETRSSFELVNSLSPEQLEKARFAKIAPPEIRTTTQRKISKLEQQGISFEELTTEQQRQLLELVRLYVNTFENEFASAYWNKIEEAGFDKLTFSWAGSLRPGVPNYWCIQGPVLLIEYDNTQTNANHVHTVIRDPTNDYGEDLLRKHLIEDH